MVRFPYRGVLICRPDEGEIVAEVSVRGELLLANEVSEVWLFDSLFIADADGDGRTFAEMTIAENTNYRASRSRLSSVVGVVANHRKRDVYDRSSQPVQPKSLCTPRNVRLGSGVDRQHGIEFLGPIRELGGIAHLFQSNALCVPLYAVHGDCCVGTEPFHAAGQLWSLNFLDPTLLSNFIPTIMYGPIRKFAISTVPEYQGTSLPR